MSNYHSDKCTKEEIQKFKRDVIDWLQSKKIETSKLKIRALTCYNGDIRIYIGHFEITNTKKSFRKTHQDGNKFYGTRGHHTTKIAQYITFNRDEWQDFLSNEELQEIQLSEINNVNK